MTEEMLEHLRKRTDSAYRRLWSATDGLTEAQAAWGAREVWHRQPWGVGLDGSIAGIVRHLAAWKEVAYQGLRSGVFPSEEGLGAQHATWEGLREWLRDRHLALASLLAGYTPSDVDRPVHWGDFQGNVGGIFTHLLEHDRYHTGQIQLLRQQMGAPPTETD